MDITSSGYTADTEDAIRGISSNNSEVATLWPGPDDHLELLKQIQAMLKPVAVMARKVLSLGPPTARQISKSAQDRCLDCSKFACRCSAKPFCRRRRILVDRTRNEEKKMRHLEDVRPRQVLKSKSVKCDDEPDDCYLSDLAMQLNRVLASRPAESHPVVQEEEIEDPAAMPMLWVSKWVDYSDKYGLGYQLCDNSVGVVFNDSTKLILQSDGENIHYIEKNGLEHYHTLKQFPETLNKKVTLLRYFRNYMNEHLLKAGASMTPRDGDDLSRLPCLRTWFRTRSAIVLHLSNGTLQINFFQDHTKIIVCPLMSAVTYINEKRESRTYRFGLIEKFGCCRELASRMRYAKTMVDRLLAAKPSSSKPKTATT